MKNISTIQEKLLSLLRNNQEDPLTIRDLQGELNLSTTSLVHHHIVQLEKLGYLKRNPSNPRDYYVITDKPERLITYLNLYGMAQCGPNGTFLNGTPIDKVPISSKILSFPAEHAFMVKAKGDSMSPKINNGDLVIAKKTNTAENGNIVVCVNDGDVLIKKIQKDNNNIILISLNSEYKPFIANNNFKVEGIVKGILSYSL